MKVARKCNSNSPIIKLMRRFKKRIQGNLKSHVGLPFDKQLSNAGG